GSSGPAQYVRLATLWGAGQMANVGGIAIMSGAYIPGTSIGGLISMGPNDAYPLRPLPDLGREASEFGTDGLANVWNQPAHDRAYLGIGLLRASHAVTSSKFYEYRGSGALTQVQLYAGGNDAPSSEATVGCAVYFAADVCEGNDTYAAADYFSCRKVMRWAAP
ncbi:MAG: hypothetical protein JST92_08945, partial [Deltaproteobacteria bacterium]|nr:hypothetical protein [Deltaproteobacteria bacterium]